MVRKHQLQVFNDFNYLFVYLTDSTVFQVLTLIFLALIRFVLRDSDDDDELKKLPEFHANYPFLYYIWDSKTKSALFTGRITKFK